jgi:glycosyltransferase involved in cell wall biosynthesis
LSTRVRRWKRQADLGRASRFDVVVIERELFNDASSDLELAFRRRARRLVLDVDDGVFLKWPEKIARVAQAADCVIAGSDLLAGELGRFSPHVAIVPTCVDVRGYAVREHVARSKPVIGWTGTSSNLEYVRQIEGPLAELAAATPFELAILADAKAHSRLPRVPGASTRFIPWSIGTETSSLLEFDVGIMPLPDDDWSRFKCGFKLIQYMAAGLPAVASPVGVNPQIVEPGVTGELAGTTAEWVAKLSGLLGDVERRRRFGLAGRRRVEERYSVQANWARWREAVLGTEG